VHARKGFYLTLVLVASLVAAVGAQIDTSTAEGQVAQHLRDLRLAMDAKNLDAIMDKYWNDQRLIILDPSDPLRIDGWQAWRRKLETLFAQEEVIFWQTQQRKIQVKGDHAVVVFYVTKRVRTGSTVKQSSDRGSYILSRINGSWKIVAQYISEFPEMVRFANTRSGEDFSKTATFKIDEYFNRMLNDVIVYDPASPWYYDGKEAWRRRVEQMFRIRQFLDLNQFQGREFELSDMRVRTVYRELRRVEGDLTSRLHGRIIWVYLRQPSGEWWLWHDHTSEIPEPFTYEQR
jgi:ketosteroid isomerase-like protein